MEKSSKNYITAVCLSAIFGVFGVHHFYLGRWLYGVLDFSLTTIGFILIFIDYMFIGIAILAIDCIHNFIVTILLLIGAYKDGEGKVVTYPGQNI